MVSRVMRASLSSSHNKVCRRVQDCSQRCREKLAYTFRDEIDAMIRSHEGHSRVKRCGGWEVGE